MPSYFIRTCKKCGLKRKHMPRSDNKGKAKSSCIHCERLYLTRYRERRWKKEKLRNTWRGMIRRCYDYHQGGYPDVPRYVDYGGKGVKVCLRWRESFEAFVSDVGAPPSRDHTLDRIDSLGDYEPKNVRWATWDEQSDNRGTTRKITAYWPDEDQEVTRSVRWWSHATGIKRDTILKRMARGWDARRAVSVTVEGNDDFYDEAPF